MMDLQKSATYLKSSQNISRFQHNLQTNPKYTKIHKDEQIIAVGNSFYQLLYRSEEHDIQREHIPQGS